MKWNANLVLNKMVFAIGSTDCVQARFLFIRRRFDHRGFGNIFKNIYNTDDEKQDSALATLLVASYIYVHEKSFQFNQSYFIIANSIVIIFIIWFSYSSAKTAACVRAPVCGTSLLHNFPSLPRRERLLLLFRLV